MKKLITLITTMVLSTSIGLCGCADNCRKTITSIETMTLTLQGMRFCMNSTDYAEYNSEGTTIRKPITALRQLGLDTAEWIAKTPTTYNDEEYGELSYEGYKARFLTREEVFNITGKQDGGFADKYNWLIDYTETCLSFGCPHEDENQSIYYNNPGYWLSTSDGVNSRGYRIDRTGDISGTNVWDERKFGVRPVIEI